jgi:MoxR-like ATPase
VVITSNRERDLPPAFVRRCVTAELGSPTPDQLLEIARTHVPGAGEALAKRVLALFGPGPSGAPTPAEVVDGVRAAHALGLAADGDDERWAQVVSVLRHRDPRD